MANEPVKHDYHLVDPSPWPIIGSVAAFLAAVGAIAYFQTLKGAPPLFGVLAGPWMLLLGFALLGYTFIGWWRDVVKESVVRGDHTPVVKLGLRYGMILFIASEVMFFVAWFWAFFDASLFPSAVEGAVATWPPKGIEVLDPFHFPLLNTLILLCSGTTVTWAHHALIHGDRQGLKTGLLATILLGALFTSIQAWEYAHAPFAFKGSIYGATFFMATGFHGFHVLVGTIFLIVCYLRAKRGDFTPRAHFGFEAAAWYWHFVDVVWLFLFVSIYVWGGWGAPIAG